MIRAILKNGVFVPLEPLPADWRDGDELDVVIKAVNDSPDRNGTPADSGPISTSEIDRWIHDVQSLGVTDYAPGERESIEAVLQAADRQSKDAVRREMGLP